MSTLLQRWRARWAQPRPARLSPADRLRTGSSGLRARPTRVVLSALGIAIGIAAMVAVVGVSSSGQAELDQRIARLGTNLVTVEPGSDLFGGDAKLPEEARGRIDRMPEVEHTSQVELVGGTNVYRSDLVPSGESGGIGAYGVDLDLLAAVRAEVREGSWLNGATSDHPAVVLGASAAQRLGVNRITPDTLVLIGDTYFSVVGVLERVELAPELDNAALVGQEVAEEVLGAKGEASTVYARVDPEQVERVRDEVGRNANPEKPNEVRVSRPSDALQAQQAADQTFHGLLLGLGGVALLVGGVGVANTMVISVLERRGEIGLRRALGATRRDIRGQFLVEAMTLSALGGVFGVLLGSLATGGYALLRGWPVSLPWWAGAGAVVATVVIGAVAGIVPALRAAAQQPTRALGTG
ncbi:ABC transporter permease [Nocardiopsis metallicus]|uniref:Putative ABC transport system permease protein n=1 Tax=Nocardiopsis metallicus TaxID=179819 RepID=A0A840WE79_9ACTN|nr:ABC transporter permease [Nocardiopsis metallicus]MBB5493723.1 putative ABC transport system permease protein [Nocardiopsis metallicus]